MTLGWIAPEHRIWMCEMNPRFTGRMAAFRRYRRAKCLPSCWMCKPDDAEPTSLPVQISDRFL